MRRLPLMNATRLCPIMRCFARVTQQLLIMSSLKIPCSGFLDSIATIALILFFRIEKNEGIDLGLGFAHNIRDSVLSVSCFFKQENTSRRLLTISSNLTPKKSFKDSETFFRTVRTFTKEIRNRLKVWVQIFRHFDTFVTSLLTASS